MIVVRSDTRGLHYLNPMHIESMVSTVNNVGMYTVYIKGVSGKDYYRNFDNDVEAARFLKKWAEGTEEHHGVQQEHSDPEDQNTTQR